MEMTKILAIFSLGVTAHITLIRIYDVVDSQVTGKLRIDFFHSTCFLASTSLPDIFWCLSESNLLQNIFHYKIN